MVVCSQRLATFLSPRRDVCLTSGKEVTGDTVNQVIKDSSEILEQYDKLIKEREEKWKSFITRSDNIVWSTKKRLIHSLRNCEKDIRLEQNNLGSNWDLLDEQKEKEIKKFYMQRLVSIDELPENPTELDFDGFKRISDVSEEILQKYEEAITSSNADQSKSMSKITAAKRQSNDTFAVVPNKGTERLSAIQQRLDP